MLVCFDTSHNVFYSMVTMAVTYKTHISSKCQLLPFSHFTWMVPPKRDIVSKLRLLSAAFENQFYFACGWRQRRRLRTKGIFLCSLPLLPFSSILHLSLYHQLCYRFVDERPTLFRPLRSDSSANDDGTATALSLPSHPLTRPIKTKKLPPWTHNSKVY